MSFLAPLMILGLAGAAIPIIIHLIGRRRARVVRFAAIDLLFGSDRRVARQLRLRELGLLAVRVAVCAALALALAKPLATCTARGPMVDRGPQAAVLVIESSLIATYRIGETTLMDRTRNRALDLLRQMGPEADVAIVTSAEGSRVPEGFSRDHIGLRDELRAIAPALRPSDFAAAMRRAHHLLASSKASRKRIYLIGTKNNIAAAAAAPLPADAQATAVITIDITDGDPIANIAIVDLTVEPHPDAGERSLKIVAQVVNHGPTPVENRPISLVLAGKEAARSEISARPGERTSIAFFATVPPDRRIADVEVRLAHDGVVLDDSRYLRAELREEVRTLIINGDPRTVRHDDEMFYLESALRPGDRNDSGIAFVAMTPAVAQRRLGPDKDRPEHEPALDLSAFDVVAIVNSKPLSGPTVRGLARWVERGGGLFIAVGENVDPDQYNRAMQRLLPQRLQAAFDVGYGADLSSPLQRTLHLSHLATEHPILTAFAEGTQSVRDARFRKIMLLGTTTDVDKRRVLARFSNGAGALIEGRRDRGRVMLFTSTIDRDWNDLAIHPGYVPLVQRIIRYLGRRQKAERPGPVLIGRRHSIPITGETRRVEITHPSGRRTVLEEQEISGRNRAAFAAVEDPGIYRVSLANADQPLRRHPELDFAVNLDARASELGESQAPPANPGVPTVAEPPPSEHKRRIELWHAIAAILLLLLLLEGLLTLR